MSPLFNSQKKNHNSEGLAIEEYLNAVTLNNIQYSKKELYENSDILKKLIDSHQVGIIGGFYDVSSGKVQFDKEPNLNLSITANF